MSSADRWEVWGSWNINFDDLTPAEIGQIGVDLASENDELADRRIHKMMLRVCKQSPHEGWRSVPFDDLNLVTLYQLRSVLAQAYQQCTGGN